MTAVALQPKLKALAERLWAEGSRGPVDARSAAIAYRLCAASILMSPPSGSYLEIRSAAPWIRRSLETYSDFADQRELSAANDFFLQMLISQPPGTAMQQLLEQEFRVGMVEASQADVNGQVELAIKLLKEIMAGRQGR
jgi:hypothetical protein